MRIRTPRATTLPLAAWLVAISLTGCLAAAAGAGAGAAIYATTRGAESLVTADISDVEQAVEETFEDEDIRITATDVERDDEGGDEREISGERGDLDVTVNLKREGSETTRVEVTARESVADWDKDYAKELLEEILRRS